MMMENKSALLAFIFDFLLTNVGRRVEWLIADKVICSGKVRTPEMKGLFMVKPNLSKENLIKAGVGVALSAALVGSCGYAYHCGNKYYENLQAEISASAELPIAEAQTEESVSHVTSFDFSSLPWKQMGYLNIQDYWDATNAKRDSIKGIADEYIDAYGSRMAEEDKTNLRWYEGRMLNAVYSDDFDAALRDFNSLASQFIPKKTYSSSGSGGGYSGDPYNFKRDGVVNWNGTRYTWYSSNVLHHYRTNEWTAGDDGFYRNDDGYIIVASNDHEQGTIVDTPWGEAIVEDSGCSSGTLDVYTNY